MTRARSRVIFLHFFYLIKNINIDKKVYGVQCTVYGVQCMVCFSKSKTRRYDLAV